MQECGWPTGCRQFTLEDPEYCSYHLKVRVGNIVADGYIFSERTTYPRDDAERERKLKVLRDVGVPPATYGEAEDARSHGDHLARHGKGKVKEGRLTLPSAQSGG